MKKDHIVEVQGRQYVLYAGLLSEAHSRGLCSIQTQIVQVPTANNGHQAVCTATIHLRSGERDMVFTGIGDASPHSASKAMHSCLLRLAETRAKARALRDALAIDIASFEELGPDAFPPASATPASAAPAPNPSPPSDPFADEVDPTPSPALNSIAPGTTPPSSPDDPPMTEKQRALVMDLCRKLRLQPEEVFASQGVDYYLATKQQTSRVIDHLMTLRQQEPPATPSPATAAVA